MQMYVHLSDCTNPAWSYTTFGRLNNRLVQLLRETNISGVEVRFGSHVVPVDFNRKPGRLSWSVPYGYQGIPTKPGRGVFSVYKFSHVIRL